jgi:polysaccharide export outer membrane protein
MIIKIKRIIVFVLISSNIIPFFTSCNSKNLKYLTNNNRQISDTVRHFENTSNTDYRLRKDDLLYIKILTTDEKINLLFNIGENSTNTTRSGQGGEFFLSGFTVNDSGYIKVPVLGDFKVIGKNMNEVRKMVQDRTDKYLIKAITDVKFVSFKITFLGETRSQGPIYIYQEKIDFLEAIGRAGGVTDFGDIKHIKVIRPTEKGYSEFFVDLTDPVILNSSNLYLYPNDIVIIDPIKNKAFRNTAQDYFMLVSILTSAISTVFLILNLTK